MRISDCSSDVCSSDLKAQGRSGRRSIRLQEPGVLQHGDLRLEAFELRLLAGRVGAQVVGTEVVGEAAGLAQLLVGAARAERQRLVVLHRRVAVPGRAGGEELADALVDADRTSVV